MDISIFKKLGFSDKQITVYLAVLSMGPSSVRTISREVGINRGTVHDCLKVLQDMGIVTFYNKKRSKYFVAENPELLLRLAKDKEHELKLIKKNINSQLPELQALYNNAGERPVARYFSKRGIRTILEDVLQECENSKEKIYRIYSSVAVREYLYDDFPEFSKERVKKKIQVKAIAIGEGGELRGLDERKWLKSTEDAETATYIIIYPNKTAYISLSTMQEPMGVVIENAGIYETQKMIFDRLWSAL